MQAIATITVTTRYNYYNYVLQLSQYRDLSTKCSHRCRGSEHCTNIVLLKDAIE